MLRVENVSVSYGRIQAVRDVSIEVREGEIVALLGGNGAGKSSLLKAILGIQPAAHGRVVFDGEDMTHKTTQSIIARGITYIPEGGGILPLMSIKENLTLGTLHNKGDVEQSMRVVYERFPLFKERGGELAGNLSGGQRQMLAIARALCSAPRMLMMDEPSIGLAPLVVAEVFRIVEELRTAGYTILVSEQNARRALQSADRGYVFEVGRMVLTGSAGELAENADVRRAYIGRG
ncbi:MAG: ABC transporter ATP-binding protein [Armatimonadetes bacterium]|nr:ABC transporter ATP-binding protein [Armatimonadota bacterium]